MNLWRTLLRPDEEELELGERTLVSKAANILQVGEFQLLQLAYRDWFGRDLPEALVSRLFSSYMLDSEVPHWARSYARQILDEDAAGRIDDARAEYHVYDHDYRSSVDRGKRRFVTAVAVLSLAVGGAIWLAGKTAVNPAVRFPPYVGADEIRTSADRTATDGVKAPTGVSPR